MLLNKPFQQLVKHQVNGGILLMVTALAAIIIANSPLNPLYQSLWEHHISFQIGSFNLFGHGGHLITLRDFINDALMAVFFFSVGLEIKREVMVGELSSVKKAMLPVVAACGGMILPVLIFYLFARGSSFENGLAIPMATDIAFALGVLSLFGKRVPLSLKIFLTAFAVVDDIGGILVIAFFYTSQISVYHLIYSALILAFLTICNFSGVKNRWIYALGCLAVWYMFMQSGVHATIAGVLVAFTVPARPRGNIGSYIKSLHESIVRIPDVTDKKVILNREQIEALHMVKSATDDAISPLQYLEEFLHRPVSYFIMPLFAFANAGVALTNAEGSFEIGVLTMAVAVALIAGKFTGIYLFTWLVVKLRITSLGDGMNWRNLAGICLLGGIGFTVSLFIANLSFSDDVILLNQAKMGVILGTVLSGITGYIVLSMTLNKDETT